jgi:predicted HTH domain antitoxin
MPTVNADLPSKAIRVKGRGMNVVLPEKVEAALNPEQARLDLAVGIYSSGRVTMGTAAEVAHLSVPAFQQELGRRRIPVNYDLEELAHDIQALDIRRGQ